jgi:hypothetical protein
VVEHALGVLLKRESDRRGEGEDPERRRVAAVPARQHAACEADDHQGGQERADQIKAQVAVAGLLEQVAAELRVGLRNSVRETVRGQRPPSG